MNTTRQPVQMLDFLHFLLKISGVKMHVKFMSMSH